MSPRSVINNIRGTTVGRHIKFGGLVILCALAFTVGSASAEENWRYVKTLEGDVTLDLDYDSKGKVVIDKSKDFESEELPRFSRVSGDSERLGRQVCSLIGK